jgi:hypothetical protein
MYQSTVDKCYDIIQEKEAALPSGTPPLAKSFCLFVFLINEVLHTVLMLYVLYYAPTVVNYIASSPIRIQAVAPQS